MLARNGKVPAGSDITDKEQNTDTVGQALTVRQ